MVQIFLKGRSNMLVTNTVNSLWYEDECFPIRDNVFLSLFEKSCKFELCKLFGK